MSEHCFSIRLNSKEYVTGISMSEKGGEDVLFEGELGELEDIEPIEDTVLHITGSKGTLMVDHSIEELQTIHMRTLSSKQRSCMIDNTCRS